MDAVPPPGTVIGSRFRVVGELGRGGMGVVLRGVDETNRPVAIKVLLPEAVEHPEAVPRFVNEARAARELTSEHAVRVLDAGMLDSGLPFMVMELLEGNDLATQLEQRGKFTVTDACDSLIDACDALAEAHARGMVHRDLKPANLFAARGADGRVRVKVLDFGVSKVAAQIRQMALTSTGTALGTPYYMAPEQLKSAKGVDARADIWSLGVVLYELLTGTLPFDGQSFGMLFMQIVSEDPKPIHLVRPEIPIGLSEVVQICMKKNREDRYADLGAFVQAIARFASASGQAQAARIAQGRGAPQPARDSNPMPVMKLKGTMVMGNAPPGLQAQIRAAAARKSSPDLSAPVPANEATLAMQPAHAGSAPNYPAAPAAPLGARAMNQDSARWSTPNPYPPPNAATPMNGPMPSMQGEMAPAAKGLPIALVVGIVAGFVLLLVLGLVLIISARH